MRKRSKSMFATAPPGLDDDADSWTVSDNLKLVRQVHEQLPQKDNIPYNERIEKIDWRQVSTENKSEEEIRKQFDILVSKIRNYRVLSEILVDLEKNITLELDLPKKQSALSLFMEEKKDELKSKIGEHGKKGSYLAMAAQQFRELSKEEKQDFTVRAKLLRKSYYDYLTSQGLDKKLKKGKGIIKEEPKPSPFLKFWQRTKERDPEITIKSAKKLYSSLDKEHKLKYILQYLKVEKGQKLNMEQYDFASKTLSKDEFGIIDDYEGRPKTMSAYNFFMKDYLGKNNTTEMANRSMYFKKMGEKWKTLSDKERAKYENMAEKTQGNYADQYIAYIKSLPLDRQSFEMNKILTKEITKRFKKKRKSTEVPKEESQDESELIKEGSQNGDEILSFQVHSSKKKKSKDPDMSQFASPSFSQASTSSPKKKYKTDKIGTEKVKEEPEIVSNKKSRKLSDNPSEDYTDHEIHASFSSTMDTSQLPNKFPSSVYKYFTKMVYDGPKEECKRAFKLLNYKEKEKITKQYEKAKKKYTKNVEGKLKTPPPKRSKHSLSQSEISNEDMSEFDSS